MKRTLFELLLIWNAGVIVLHLSSWTFTWGVPLCLFGCAVSWFFVRYAE